MTTLEASNTERFYDRRFLIVNPGSELTSKDLDGIVEASGEMDDGRADRAVIAFPGSTPEELLQKGGLFSEHLKVLATMAGYDLYVVVHDDPEIDPLDNKASGKNTTYFGYGEDGDESTRPIMLHFVTKGYFEKSDGDVRDVAEAVAKKILSE